MALNQIPYTNVHELNLDWILAKIKELESRIEEIEDYGDDIAELRTDLTALETSIRTLKASVNSSILALNARCNSLEDSQDELKDSMAAFYESVKADIAEIETAFDSFNTALTTLRTYNDTSNTVILNEAKAYTRERIAALLDYFEDPGTVYVVNPWTNEVLTIQQMIDYLHDILNYATLTCAEFDAMGLTCADFDSLGISCEEFDNWGKWAFYFRGGYVNISELTEILGDYATKSDIADMATRAQLENYATLNDVKVISPVTGILGSAQQAFNDLASLHQNCLTAGAFDALELDCNTIDGLEYTAFEHDFYSVIKLYQDGVITQFTGITAEQWQSIVVGTDGALYTTIL